MRQLEASAFTVLSVAVCGVLLCDAGYAQKRQLNISEKATLEYAAPWSESQVKVVNAHELVRMGPIVGRGTAPASPQTRFIATLEPRTNFTDATNRLVDIAFSRHGDAKITQINGWPALEFTFTEFMPRSGDAAPTNNGPPLIRRAIVAIASDNELARFEIWPSIENTDQLLKDAINTVHSYRIAREAHGGLAPLLTQLQQRIQKGPPPVTVQRSGGGKQANPAWITRHSGAQVATGNGELELATSANGTAVVIAGGGTNVALSTDGGSTFGGAGNPFSSNDPTVSRGASGNFYVGQISACSDAVTRSTDGGKNFARSGVGAFCAVTGNGMCLADQPHIAADAVNSASGGDQLYVVWRNFTAVWPSQPAICTAIGVAGGGYESETSNIACSTNNGVTWSAPAALPGGGDFPRVAVGKDGKVYVVSLSGDSIVLSRFTSCASGLQLDSGFPVQPANLSGTVSCPVPGLDRCNDGNTLSSPIVAPDPAAANHLFISFAESDGSGGERVVTMESTDSGTNFGNRIAVSAPTSARRFMPWSCSTQGTVFVGWYDRGAATAPGATNDLTDYVLGSPTLVTPLNQSNNPDPQCAAPTLVPGVSGLTPQKWACGVRSQNDATSCSLQPQFAGLCQNGSGGGSGNACNFNAPVCPSGESCKTSFGCPKFGDYNGIACTPTTVIAAWASATSPKGLPPTSGITLFTSVVNVAPPPPQAPHTFNRIVVTLITGNDNATSSSEIAGTIPGQAAVCLKPSTNLPADGICSNGSGAKDHNAKDTWDNWTTSTQTFSLSPQVAAGSGLPSIAIALRQSGCSLSCDNWDIQGLTVTLQDSTGALAPKTLINMANPNNGDNCIARLKASPNATTVVFTLNGSNGHTYLDGTAAERGKTTTCKNNGDGGD